MTRLLAVVGLLLVAGFLVTLAAPPPGVSGTATAPVPEGELWRLNAH